MADGRVLDCDNHHHQELFWALRGAGAGNFGVVTQLVFGTVPTPQVTNFHLTWPAAQAAALIKAWQEWAPQHTQGSKFNCASGSIFDRR